MTRWYAGIEHGCEDPDGRIVTRYYPVWHWLGEGPNDPPDHPVRALGHSCHRKVLVCDACGRTYETPEDIGEKWNRPASDTEAWVNIWDDKVMALLREYAGERWEDLQDRLLADAAHPQWVGAEYLRR